MYTPLYSIAFWFFTVNLYYRCTGNCLLEVTLKRCISGYSSITCTSNFPWVTNWLMKRHNKREREWWGYHLSHLDLHMTLAIFGCMTHLRISWDQFLRCEVVPGNFDWSWEFCFILGYEIDLGSCFSFQYLAERVKSLRMVSFLGSPNVSDVALKRLALCKKIQCIKIDSEWK